MTLQQFLRILRARWLIISTAFVLSIAIAVAASLLLPPRYTSTATVVAEFKGIDPISGSLLPLLPVTTYLATQVDIINSPGVARRAVDILNLAENPSAKELWQRETEGRGQIRDWLADLLLRDLSVEPSRESNVIRISYTGNDPRFSAAVANAFVSAYINTVLEMRVDPARQTAKFFDEQMETLKNNLAKAQSRLSDYQRKNGITAADERLDVENMRLMELSSQLVAAQAQTYDTLSRQRQVQEFIAKRVIPEAHPDVLSNAVIQNLKTSLVQLDIKLNDLSARVGQNHPAYLAVKSEIDGVKQQMLDEMKTIGQALANSAGLAQRREDQIRASLNAQRNKVLAMKQVRDDQAVLLRDMESAQRTYDAAMARMTHSRLESQATQTNVSVVNEAVAPLKPSFPNIVLNLAIAIVLGSIFGVAAALVREIFDRTVRSEEDLESVLELPVLGVISSRQRRLPRWRSRGRLRAPAAA